MGYETYTGVVTREVDTGEADRYLTILSVERGKIECYAKGIRKSASKLASQAGLATYGEFELYKSKDRYVLTSAKAIEKFYNIRTDVVKCAYAAHFLEIARDVVVEEQGFPQALQTLLNTLHVLCYRDLPPDFIARVFEIRILALAGFAPVLDRCSICGDAEARLGVFAVHGDGLVCDSDACRLSAGRHVPVSKGAVRAMRHIVESDAGDIFRFTLSGAALAELTDLTQPYLRYHFGREYVKLDEAERYRAFEREIAEYAVGAVRGDK